MGSLVYEPPRDGPTLWEIGIPDRTAAEFFVPDPNPMYINKLYVNHTQKYVKPTRYIYIYIYVYADWIVTFETWNTELDFFKVYVELFINNANLYLAGLGNMDCGKDTQICILLLT